MTYEFFAIVAHRKETAVILLSAAAGGDVAAITRLTDALERELGGLLKREGVPDGLVTVRVEVAEKEDCLGLTLVTARRFGLRRGQVDTELAQVGAYQLPRDGQLN